MHHVWTHAACLHAFSMDGGRTMAMETSLLIFVYVFYVYCLYIHHFRCEGSLGMLWSRRLVRSFHIDLILLLLFCQSAILPKNLWNGIQHQIRAPRDLSFLSLLLISHLFYFMICHLSFSPQKSELPMTVNNGSANDSSPLFWFSLLFYFCCSWVDFLLFRDSWE